MSLWRPALVALVPMLLCFSRALSWRYVDQHSEGVRLLPRGEHLLAAAAIAMPLFPAMALLWSAITRRLKTRLAVVLVLMVVLGAVGGLAAMIAWVPLFDGHYEAVVPSPDGKREAHLRIDGLLGCRASVFVGERRALWGELTAERKVDCEGYGARWLEDGGVEVTGNAPEPLNLDFGPH